MISSIEILRPGLASSIQDTGRWGYQGSGVPVSGAVDEVAFRLANLLVDNQADAAAIEFMIMGPDIKFNVSSFIAITGGVCQVWLNDQLLEQNQAYQVMPGAILKFKPITNGRFGYLAIKGGILTKPILNSRSTSVRIQLGGINGRNLQAADQLPIKATYQLKSLARRKLVVNYPTENLLTIRFVKGPQWQQFSPKAQQLFTQEHFYISQQADRMGYRLAGPVLPIPAQSMLSEGTVTGNIQVTRSGQPIVLLADRQTAGGYPVIGTVCLADLDKLIQANNQQQLKFKPVSTTTATLLLQKETEKLHQLAVQFRQARYQLPIGPQQAAGSRIAEFFK